MSGDGVLACLAVKEWDVFQSFGAVLCGSGSSRGIGDDNGVSWRIQSHVGSVGSGAEGLVCLFSEGR